MKGEYLRKQSRDILQRMSNMHRYNNEVHIHDENVAEHSFYVAMYAMEICNDLKIKKYIADVAIKMALCHDVHETVISDIPHNIKARIHALSNICDHEEAVYNEEHLYDVFFDNGLDENENKTAHLIVDLADIISVLQYAQLEVSIGNKLFEKIIESANGRIDDVCFKLYAMNIDASEIKSYLRGE